MENKERSIARDRMLELKRQLEEQSNTNIKQMTYLTDVNLLLNNREQAILVEKELENQEKEYELYKVEEDEFKKISEYDKEENKLVLLDDYIEGELEKTGINQKLEVKLTPEEIVEKAQSVEELEEIKKSVSKEEAKDIEEAEEQKDMTQDEIETQEIQDDLGIELSACYKVEDERFASNVLGKETGEDHYIGVEKGTGRHVVISGSHKSGYHQNQEINSSIGGGEAADQNSNLVIKDKNNQPVIAIDSKNGNFYALEKNENDDIVPRRIDARPMDVAQKQKFKEVEEKENNKGFVPGPDLEERTYRPKYY